MLPPVTEKYIDRSTDRFFKFVFLCDECSRAWESEEYPFSLRDSPPKDAGEGSAHELIWRSEHDAAYERSNTDALLHFNRCPVCRRRICDECFSELEVVCLKCESKKEESK